MSKKIKNIILGAGPTGLSIAKKLEKNTIVVEKESQVGGLCRSICKDGGVFDIGGHSFHTPHQNVYEYCLVQVSCSPTQSLSLGS